MNRETLTYYATIHFHFGTAKKLGYPADSFEIEGYTNFVKVVNSYILNNQGISRITLGYEINEKSKQLNSFVFKHNYDKNSKVKKVLK